jgi:hypothetical protein
MSVGRLFGRLKPWMEGFERAVGMDLTGLREGLASPEQRVPHTQLRLVLQGDPAMEALLPGVRGCIALGDESCAPFRVMKRGLVLLPPVLVVHSGAAAVAARWGGEALSALGGGGLTKRRLVALIRHGKRLLELSDVTARELLFKLMPDEVVEELGREGVCRPSPRLCAWQAGIIEGASWDEEGEEQDGPMIELELPMEEVLVSGGDSRLIPEAASGLNKYGVCPRPRPEAVHFSSSTASAISGHGFLYADMIRRGLLDEALKAGGVGGIRADAVRATAREIAALIGLAKEECDVVVTPSGTDAELVSVMVALAGAGGRVVTNVLVSPEESGRGVGLAGAGRYFDDQAATRELIKKGASAFEGSEIEVQEVAIRDENGHVREVGEMNAAWLEAAEAGLKRGHHLLVHVLLGSKTGLSAPSLEVVEQLTAAAGGRVDVVVDACQMRSSPEELGGLVRRGWMVQVSGSKFFTGPPFSGALMMPVRLRERAGVAGELLNKAPGVSLPSDWPTGWASEMKRSEEAGSLGAVFRWLPALMEGRLYAGLQEGVKQSAFERFRAALVPRILESPYVEPIGDELSGGGQTDIGRLSIMAFQVLGRRRGGEMVPLTERESQWLFEQLNRDMTSLITEWSPQAEATARLCCHIGQPVVLRGKTRALTFLRLVLGARFFNMVGHAEEGSAEAVLASEIADAKRVLSKIEWIAAQWWRFEPMVATM